MNTFLPVFKRVLQQITNRYYANSALPRKLLEDGPGLKEFLVVGKNLPKNSALPEDVPYLLTNNFSGNNRKVFFEVYGCQMNVSDTEIVWSILKRNNYLKVEDIKEADVVLLITCAIREGAETKIWNRLKHLTAIKKHRSQKNGPFQVGILGCMAERLKTEVLEKEKSVDIVAGPDSYKDLPRLLAIAKGHQSAVNVLLSLDETYADIMPVKLNENAVTAYVSIMRGCDNMCSYCIVPFTRGRERSRPILSIEEEVKHLADQGIKEITLLGQNVNSYRDLSGESRDRSFKTSIVPGFQTVYKDKIGGMRFSELLRRIAEAVPEVRIRFTSPHPKDFPEDVLETIKLYPNICNSLHLPAQSGNSAVLERMRRGYTREAYLQLIANVRRILPNVTLSSDFICGFCGETDEEFQDTLSLMEEVKYNVAYLFAYSMREKTTAHRRFQDDIAAEVKNHRLQEMVEVFRKNASELHKHYHNQEHLILVEGTSKRSITEYYGRNDGNIKVIIKAKEIADSRNSINLKSIQPGDYVAVKITQTNSQGLKGEPLYHTSIRDFYM